MAGSLELYRIGNLSQLKGINGASRKTKYPFKSANMFLRCEYEIAQASFAVSINQLQQRSARVVIPRSRHCNSLMEDSATQSIQTEFKRAIEAQLCQSVVSKSEACRKSQQYFAMADNHCVNHQTQHTRRQDAEEPHRILDKWLELPISTPTLSYSPVAFYAILQAARNNPEI